MSMPNDPKEIQGEIGDQQRSANSFRVTELAPDQFIVTDSGKTTEIFLNPSGLLSDGNAIDGIEVKVLSAKERIINERFGKGQKTAGGTGSKGMTLKAPMPGMVKAISVVVGDKVQKNSQVLVLEAMKMENSITAGFSGVVKKIHAETGVSVEKNMPLIEFSQE